MTADLDPDEHHRSKELADMLDTPEDRDDECETFHDRWSEDQQALAAAWEADDEPIDLPERVEGEPFRVTNDELADWALRKQARALVEVERVRTAAEKRRAALKAFIEPRLAEVDAWEVEALASPAHDAAFFESVGIDYYRQRLAENPKLAKTYKLPSGELSRRAARVSYEVIDAEKLVAWATENDPAALSTPKPLVSALKGAGYTLTDGGDVVAPTGEVVPGVHAVGGEDTFSAKPAQSLPDAF